MRTLLLVPKFKSRIEKDSLNIINTIDSLFSLFPNKDTHFIVKAAKQYFGSNYLSQYFFYHFKDNRTDKNCAYFYNLSPFLYAPKETQAALMGRSLMADIKLGVGDHIQEKATHFIECYPNSDYAIMLKKYLKESKSNAAINITTIDNISSLSELSNIEQLKGKYILVDLWATWCIPCRKEFEFSQSLDNLIKSFKDLVLVYISLDKGTNLQKWTEIAQKYNLEGIHTVADKKLQEDIRLQVFNATKENILLPKKFTIKENVIEGSSMTIPRYFLLDKKGEVIYSNLPRPSSQNKLKEVLESLLNNN